MSKITIYPVKIIEAHLDSFGHVNNAMYLSLYEEARWELITQGGYGFKEIHARQEGPVVLDVTLKFLKELRLRETIEIQTKLLDYTKKIGRLEQKMIKADGAIASEAVFTFALFDMKERKLMEPTPAWRKALGLDG